MVLKKKYSHLQCIAHSGESFSNNFQIGLNDNISLYTQKEYWIHVKTLVSNLTLEIAVKIRSLRESTMKPSKSKVLTCIENNELKRHDFIWICNKIIHAKSFNLVPVSSVRYEHPIEWWDGEIEATGTFQGKQWSISFDAKEWLQSCLYNIKKFESYLVLARDSSKDLVRCI